MSKHGKPPATSAERTHWREKLQAGRDRMKRRCVAAALKYTPDGVAAVQVRKSLTGRAYAQERDGTYRIAVPRPFTRKSLYIFLHECAHVHLGHCAIKFSTKYRWGWTRACRKPAHVRELEAEKQAHEWMRAEGIPVPKTMTARAKRYVGWKIGQAEVRGAKKIDANARRFSE